MGMKESNMKKLLMAMVAVGFVVGCGGDTTGAKTTTKTETKVSTPSGDVKTETKKTEETQKTEDTK